MKNLLLAACVTLFPMATLPAQKLPLPDGSGRIVQVFDLGAPAPGPELVLPVLGDARVAKDDGLQRTADLLARFVKPPIGRGDELRVLGDRWLTLLGSPEQAASLEALFATAAKHRTTEIVVEMNFLNVKADAFAKHWRARLAAEEGSDGRRFQQVLGKDGANSLVADLAQMPVERLQAPGITVLPLRIAQLSSKRQISYVRDWKLVQGEGKVIAEPMTDTVEEGQEATVCATLLANGDVALTVDVTNWDVQEPLPEFKTTIGVNNPVTIQLPEVAGLHLQQTAVVADGGMVVLASQKADGDFLIATIRARAEAK